MPDLHRLDEAQRRRRQPQMASLDPSGDRHRDPVEVIAGIVLALVMLGAGSYAFILAWRVLS